MRTFPAGPTRLSRSLALPVFAIPVLAVLFLLAAATPLGAQELTPDQQIRRDQLEHQFMSPCCYGEELYGHMSPAAQEMKSEISQMVSGGKTDREIIDFYKAKFGERILTEPEGTKWWVINIMPFALLGLGLLATIFVIRRWMRPATPSAA